MKGTITIACILVCAGTAVQAASVYPATYPFDKAAIGFPDIPMATPNEAKITTTEDPGGYFHRLYNCDPYSNTPPNLQECRWMVHLHYASTEAIGTEAPPNCTLIDAPLFKSEMLPGVLGGKTVCKKGECCKYYEGAELERFAAINGLHNMWNEQATAASCPVMSEPAYCAQLGTAFFKCTSYMPEQNSNKRSVMRPCMDAEFIWLLSCPLFKASGDLMLSYNKRLSFEPDHYLEKLSPKQQLVFFPGMFAPDKVCHPYSYFFPDASPGPSTPSPDKDSSFAFREFGMASVLAAQLIFM